ncbi:hypothetical protein N7453_011481 [Penicillium expansum]|nr:hypothetical protein N7453_011481 [Penicillium expansum]
MGFFAFEEWAAANRNYENTPAPYWHVNSVPNGFTAISGILWSISYILMTKKAFKDRSYAMPLHCLCLNITLEAVYGFVYGPGLLNQLVFAQWMIFDVVLFYAILRSAPYAWRQSPLVAQHLAGIIVVGHIYPENWSEGRVYDRMAHAGPYQSKLDSTATVAWKNPRSLLGDLVDQNVRHYRSCMVYAVVYIHIQRLEKQRDTPVNIRAKRSR